MWKADDDFWLTLPGNKDESALLIALGIHPLRITASVDDEDEVPVDRDGHIDITILSFDRKSNTMHGSVIENTSGLGLTSRTFVMKVDEYSESEICRVHSIEGITF